MAANASVSRYCRFTIALICVWSLRSMGAAALRNGDRQLNSSRILAQPSGGASAAGQARGFLCILDETLRRYETVLVGGGSGGVEVELAPGDLALLSGGEWISFSRRSRRYPAFGYEVEHRVAQVAGRGTGPALRNLRLIEHARDARPGTLRCSAGSISLPSPWWAPDGVVVISLYRADREAPGRRTV